MSQTGLIRRYLPNPIYLRMLGYSATLVVHLKNSMTLKDLYKGDMLQDPDVAYFEKYQNRLLTIWNIYFQVFYAALGLSCDVLSLTSEGKDSSLLKTLKNIRDLLFSAAVWPFTCAVFVIFWTLFTYEPTIVLPPGVYNTLPRISNHVIHTFILPVVLWEVTFRPRKTPASHLLNLVVVFVYSAVFIGVLFFTRFETGQFPYPILNLIDGTPILYGFLVICVLWIFTSYRAQWYITEYLWGIKDKNIKVL